MRGGLQHWARACLLIALVVLGTAPLDLQVGQTAGVNAHPSTVADDCCETEVDARHAAARHTSECLQLCGTGGQALAPASVGLPLPLAPQFRLESDTSGDTRFADLDPHPPKRLSDTI